MKVAVTGGTGFVGRHLVNRLLTQGHEVTVLTHRKSAADLFRAPVTLRDGSINDTGSLRRVFEGVQVVYHLVGIIVEADGKTFSGTVVEGTRSVVAACREAGVGQLIYLSALGTSAEASTAYHRSKFLAEETVKNSGIPYVILRSSVIYGSGDGFVSMLTRMIRQFPVVPVVGTGRYLLQPIYIDDLTQAMVKVMGNPAVNGRIIDLAGPEPLSYMEILRTIQTVLGKKRLNFRLPLWLLRPIAVVSQAVLTKPPLTRDQLKMLEMGNTGNIGAMKELLSVEPISFEQGLKQYLR